MASQRQSLVFFFGFGHFNLFRISSMEFRIGLALYLIDFSQLIFRSFCLDRVIHRTGILPGVPKSPGPAQCCLLKWGLRSRS